MKIFVDADSCPKEIRNIIMKAGERTAVPAVFVANHVIPDLGERTELVVVPPGEGKADEYILDRAGCGDLVVTRDIPLAAELVHKKVTVINDRGERFTKENIGERLSLRNHMKTLREHGMAPGLGGKQFGEREKKRFADTFNRELTRLRKKIKAIP